MKIEQVAGNNSDPIWANNVELLPSKVCHTEEVICKCLRLELLGMPSCYRQLSSNFNFTKFR